MPECARSDGFQFHRPMPTMIKPKYYTSIVALMLLAPICVEASGTYTVRPPRPPGLVRRDAIPEQRDKYEEGKRIYSGKAKLTTRQSAANTAEQEKRLRALQARLPESAAKETDLTALAGKLTWEQLDALEYYVRKKYP